MSNDSYGTDLHVDIPGLNSFKCKDVYCRTYSKLLLVPILLSSVLR